MLAARTRYLNTQSLPDEGPVLYWMRRDQRVDDNWALIRALDIAEQENRPCAVVFVLEVPGKTYSLRQREFMILGLQEVSKKLTNLGIVFFLVEGDAQTVLPKFIKDYKISHLVSDFSPLYYHSQQINYISDNVKIPVEVVDAHNIVPVWTASDKQEVGARTLRPKLHKLLDEYMDEFPAAGKYKIPAWNDEVSTVNWESLRDQSASHYDHRWIGAGSGEAYKKMRQFVEGGIVGYAAKRNDPNQSAQSDFSPYLHFGTLSAQRLAQEVMASVPPGEDKNSFLEELIVRRELSDNFCFYNSAYDSYTGFPNWAQKSLDKHRGDERQYLYSFHELEEGKTHDDLWNASQWEMRMRGKMHGYMRMYWAKKILEWTSSPEEALSVAIQLNDTYEFDGHDPNGYAGVAWSIGGVHDRAWFERPIFGLVRYMSYSGCQRKFDIDAYIKQWLVE